MRLILRVLAVLRSHGLILLLVFLATSLLAYYYHPYTGRLLFENEIDEGIRYSFQSINGLGVSSSGKYDLFYQSGDQLNADQQISLDEGGFRNASNLYKSGENDGLSINLREGSFLNSNGSLAISADDSKNVTQNETIVFTGEASRHESTSTLIKSRRNIERETRTSIKLALRNGSKSPALRIFGGNFRKKYRTSTQNFSNSVSDSMPGGTKSSNKLRRKRSAMREFPYITKDLTTPVDITKTEVFQSAVYDTYRKHNPGLVSNSENSVDSHQYDSSSASNQNVENHNDVKKVSRNNYIESSASTSYSSTGFTPSSTNSSYSSSNSAYSQSGSLSPTITVVSGSEITAGEEPKIPNKLAVLVHFPNPDVDSQGVPLRAAVLGNKSIVLGNVLNYYEKKNSGGSNRNSHPVNEQTHKPSKQARSYNRYTTTTTEMPTPYGQKYSSSSDGYESSSNSAGYDSSSNSGEYDSSSNSDGHKYPSDSDGYDSSSNSDGYDPTRIMNTYDTKSAVEQSHSYDTSYEAKHGGSKKTYDDHEKYENEQSKHASYHYYHYLEKKKDEDVAHLRPTIDFQSSDVYQTPHFYQYAHPYQHHISPSHPQHSHSHQYYSPPHQHPPSQHQYPTSHQYHSSSSYQYSHSPSHGHHSPPSHQQHSFKSHQHQKPEPYSYQTKSPYNGDSKPSYQKPNVHHPTPAPSYSTSDTKNNNPYQQHNPKQKRHHYPQKEHNYPKQEHRYLQKEHKYPQKEHKYPQKENHYPEKEHHYPQKGNHYPEKKHHYPQKEHHYPKKSHHYPQKSLHYSQKSHPYPQKPSYHSPYGAVPKYYRLSFNSTCPVPQPNFLVNVPQEFELYLLDSHDFNRLFNNVVYVADNVTLDSESYVDGKVQDCNPCNRKYNERYPSYTDFSGRYVSCSVPVLYPEVPGVALPTHYDKCANDIEYEAICNPCERKQKVVEIPKKDGLTVGLRLPFEEIQRLGRPFWDDRRNYYEFITLSNYNIEFDETYGHNFPYGYDLSDIYRYYLD